MRRLLASTVVPSGPRQARFADAGYGVTAQPDWRTVDWGEQLRRARLDGVEIAYVDVGPRHDRGLAPVVFVHGLGGQWQNWLENIPRAALERRVVALDLPGFGVSPPATGEVTIPFYGRVVEGLCERLELGPVALVGNSMGGFVAAEVAIAEPDRVERLALVSAAGISSANMVAAPVLTLGRAASAFAAFSAVGHREVARHPRSRHLALALVARHPSLLKPDLAYEGFIKGAGKPGFNDAFRAIFAYDVRARLPEIGCPTLVVWGEQDAIIPVRDAQEFERLIPDCRKVVMRDTGHVSMAERPEAFNELLAGFLGESGSAEAGKGASQAA